MCVGIVDREGSSYLPFWIVVYHRVRVYRNPGTVETGLWGMVKTRPFHWEGDNNRGTDPGLLSGDYPFGHVKETLWRDAASGEAK